MTENLSMKKLLIMQSFAPLFLILFVKYFDIELIPLCGTFCKYFMQSPKDSFAKTVGHPLFITLLLEFLCLLWILYSLYGIKEFKDSQRANFISQGETLVDIERIPNSGVTFFMTYVLPMAMDDLDTLKGIIVFGILMIILLTLMWKTNLYYQNPVLIVLGYEVFSFKFETTQLVEYKGKNCIGITRGSVRTEHIIKRQIIADNVFLIYEDM